MLPRRLNGIFASVVFVLFLATDAMAQDQCNTACELTTYWDNVSWSYRFDSNVSATVQQAFSAGAITWSNDFANVNANLSAGHDQNGTGFTVAVVPPAALQGSTNLAETYQPGQHSSYPNGAILINENFLNGNPSYNQIQALMTHEIGHGFGIADSGFDCTYESVMSTYNSFYAAYSWLTASDLCWLNNGWNPFWTPPGGQPYAPAPILASAAAVQAFGVGILASGVFLVRRQREIARSRP